ncbi:hypothetical protein SAMN00768000_1475 [Sulfobacillus thermosulfidooxidans DSM 9293]|uniref:LysM domain-containing protein n=1 Tax=Sulfobacillus thermosulfidooxidans (strain DSM 9293 / VKM B-1269 / AT-1) TaxID=929705 RepID=A0A1W1WCT1_SULTA|nr:hypothetical protein [Sulfobacillus thermosulfidooxidans]SMC04121.1 hypothetical protein SAMN00768000_1475 [Sulfobacillus thermosulfidooxidans DSM 9293]
MMKSITILAAGLLVAGGASLTGVLHGETPAGSTLQNIELSANAKAPASNSQRHSWHHGKHGFAGRFMMVDAAKALNISPSMLKADLKAGDSLATIAQDHGSSTTALENTLLADAKARINQAVSAGKLTQTQATKIDAHLSTRIDRMVTHPGFMHGPWSHKRHHFGLMGHVLPTVAKDLNISPSTLKADLKAGDSLATIAQDHGSSATALENILLADAKARINQAVSAGKMSQTQASRIETHLSTWIDQIVTHPGFMHGPWSHKRHHFGLMGHVLPTVAKDLNISPSTLKADLKAGDSLATIAQDHGSSATALENTLLADAKARINQAVSAGKMTQTQATKIEAHLSTWIDQMVTHTGMPMHGAWNHQDFHKFSSSTHAS